MKRAIVAGMVFVVSVAFADTGTITTVPATAGTLNTPYCVALDRLENLFIADGGNKRIVRVDAASGTLTSVAGDGTMTVSGDGGPATQAGIGYPYCVAVDGAGNLFISDGAYNRVRRVDGATGIIATFAGNGASASSGDGGPAVNAGIYGPNGLAIDGQGNLFIAEQFGHRVRRVDAASGIISTVAGTGVQGFAGDGGPATAASLAYPGGLALDSAGNLFLTDRFNNRIRRVAATTGIISTVAGNGSTDPPFNGDGIPAVNATIHNPEGMAVDTAGNLFIADESSFRVRRVDVASGIISTVAGNGVEASTGDGGPATSASLDFPTALTLNQAGNLFVTESIGNRVRRVFLPGTSIYTASYVTSSLPTAGTGQTVTFTAMVSPIGTSGTLTGVVQFLDTQYVTPVLLGTATLSGGSASFSTSTLNAGFHNITASYGGDASYFSSTSPGVLETVKPATVVTVSSTPNPSDPHQAVAFSVSVALASGTPQYPITGRVQLFQGATLLGTATLSGAAATLSAAFDPGGPYAITAVYSGDSNYAGSTSPVYTQNVRAASTTTVSAQPSPAVAGQTVKFTAMVSPSTATGTVQFQDGATFLGSAPVSSGTAWITTSTLSAGNHTITAGYSGDANNLASSASVSLMVKTATATSLTSSANPAVYGQSVQFTATVSPSAATGSVQFLDGQSALGTVSLSSGTASLNVASLAAGYHSITAIYSGDATFASSTSPALTENIHQAATSLVLSSNVNPSTYGQAVTFTVTVTPSAATGTVQFFDGLNGLGAVNLAGGTASVTTSLVVGSHSISASYGGDLNYSGSITGGPLVEVVNKAASSTSLASSLNPSVRGQTVTFTATISPRSAGGTAQFFDGSTSLGFANITAGQAALSTSSLSVGVHSVKAVYSGDSSFAGSTSAILTQTVNRHK